MQLLILKIRWYMPSLSNAFVRLFNPSIDLYDVIYRYEKETCKKKAKVLLHSLRASKRDITRHVSFWFLLTPLLQFWPLWRHERAIAGSNWWNIIKLLFYCTGASKGGATCIAFLYLVFLTFRPRYWFYDVIMWWKHKWRECYRANSERGELSLLENQISAYSKQTPRGLRFRLFEPPLIRTYYIISAIL